MTQILQTYVFGENTDPKIITDWHQLEHESFEQYLLNKIKPYYGMTQSELKLRFGIRNNPKNINELILARILGVTGQISTTEEFKKAAINPKTIRIQKNGAIKESMSFPAFKFIPLSQETVWEESELYGMLAEKKFMFVIFKENLTGNFVLEKVLFWNIPYKDLQQVEIVWRKTVETIRNGVVITRRNNRNYNNLPKQTENPVAHVRPHGINSRDTDLLPDGRQMTKQCFWLNNSYIHEQIEKHLSQ